MLFFAPGGCSRRVCDPPMAGRRSQTGFEFRITTKDTKDNTKDGFPVTPEQVLDVLAAPDAVIPQSGNCFIAQKRISEEYVLRVIYRSGGEDLVVIPFYPGRRERYESKV